MIDQWDEKDLEILLRVWDKLKLAEEIKQIINEAYDDMAVLTTPDYVSDKSVKELREKINKLGKGTLGYIATKHKEAIEKIDSIVSTTNKG